MQFWQVSIPSHVPSPQPQPQSSEQPVQFSPGSHTWLPQTAHAPQSTAHVVQLSPTSVSQVSLPQHEPQSTGQVLHDSSPVHIPSPQEHAQSAGQSAQVSPGSQEALPHAAGATQAAVPLPAGSSTQFSPAGQ